MLYIRTNIQNYAFYIIIIIHLVRDEFQNYVIINHLVIISQYIYIYILWWAKSGTNKYGWFQSSYYSLTQLIYRDGMQG